MLPKKKAKELLEIYANLDYRLIDPDFSLKIQPKHKSRSQQKNLKQIQRIYLLSLMKEKEKPLNSILPNYEYIIYYKNQKTILK